MKIIFSFLLITVFSNVALFSQSQCLCNPRHPFDDCINDGLTRATAYQIWTLAHLLELRDSINNDFSKLEQFQFHFGKHFRLMQDIDTVKEVIAWHFRGAHFHGGGHKITVALNYNPQTFSDGALFVAVGNGGSIDSLTVDGYINGGFAGIVGTVREAGGNNFFSASSVTNCTVNVTITGVAGGIAYSNSGIISNSVFNGSITGVDRISGISGISGIVGINEPEGQIIACINNGKIVSTGSGVSGSFSNVGGIVGTMPNSGGTVSHNINNGIVEGQRFVGGIAGTVVGQPIRPANIMNNANYGFVKGTTAVGGVIGHIFSAGVNVFNNFNSGVVIGVSETGCIVGRNNGGTISNNHYDKQMCGE